MATVTPEHRKHWRRAVLAAGAAVLVAAAAFRLAFAGVSWWIDCGDAPEDADIIVVLGGGFARPLFGADLYLGGRAPQIWLSRVRRDEIEDRIRELGIDLPPETDINHAILLKKGVPEKAIHFYGLNLNSTYEEAKALAAGFDGRGRKIILVTSRFHARRARMIFRHRLPAARILVCPTPYDTFDRRWWRHKDLALNSLMEIFKAANFLIGSPFGREP